MSLDDIKMINVSWDSSGSQVTGSTLDDRGGYTSPRTVSASRRAVQSTLIPVRTPRQPYTSISGRGIESLMMSF
jgi:hypothetical protein